MSSAQGVPEETDKQSIGPAFRSEIGVFLLITEIDSTLPGRRAIGDPSFVTKLNSGASPQLSALERTRAWTRKTVSYGERAAITRSNQPHKNFLSLVTAFLYHSPLTEGEFGKRAIADGGFVAGLRKGDAPAMDAADRVLLFMGEPTIGVAFRSEVAAFLLVIDTNGTLLGCEAIGDSSFMTKLNAGKSPRLSAVERVRAWMRKIASYGERAAIARAIADPGVPDPALNPDPAALDALAERTPCTASDGESLPKACSHPIEQELFLTEAEAADFLRFKPVTLSRYRVSGDGPAYFKLGGAIRYYRADLLAWAWARRHGHARERF